MPPLFLFLPALAAELAVEGVDGVANGGMELVALQPGGAELLAQARDLLFEAAEPRVGLAGAGTELVGLEPMPLDLDAELADLAQQPLDDVLGRLRPLLSG
jgi:hypothetical protein